MNDMELLALAKAAAERAYAPYSGFKVGAAALARSGRVYTGCNVENASYGATCCAERTALFKAVSEGEDGFDAVAVYGGDGGDCYPCGICLQVLSELAPRARIIVGEGKAYGIAALLPHAFTLTEEE